MTTRAAIVAEARSFIGTPFLHQGRMKGVGVDCIGLVIEVARKLGMVAPDFDVNGYGREPDGTLLDQLAQHLSRTSEAEMKPGDVVVVRFAGDPQHVGIVSPYLYEGRRAIVHASSTIGGVIETRLLFGAQERAMKFVAAFSWPGVA